MYVENEIWETPTFKERTERVRGQSLKEDVRLISEAFCVNDLLNCETQEQVKELALKIATKEASQQNNPNGERK